ncbi:hypothetical protein JCM3770_007082 [Rhodotorula araucariae]
MARTHHRVLSGVAALANCLTAGAPFTFPLWSPHLQAALRLNSSQLNLVASSAILGEYALAAYFGALADKRGPGAVSFVAAVLFATGFGMLVWRYNLAQATEDAPWYGEWLVLAFCWFLVGCGTAASYFSGIISLAKSTPSRHSGLAIGVPCAVFGLSPLFLSTIASFFTTTTSSDAPVRGDDIQVGRYLASLGILLTLVNALGGLLIQELPWAENIDKPFVDAVEPFDGDRVGVNGTDSGLVVSSTSSVDDSASERTALLQRRAAAASPDLSAQSEPLRSFVATASFWLLGGVVFLATGPAEMYMASLGAIVSSLAGSRSLQHGSTSALALRTRHIALLSVANTASRLLVGAASDYLAASALTRSGTQAKEPQPACRKHVRLIFVAGACVVLAGAYGWGATGLSTPAGLWLITLATAVAYGTVFTLTPALVRARWSVADFGRNWGLLTWFSALGALLFTPLFGVLRDLATDGSGPGSSCTSTRCFRPIFALAAVSAALAAALVGVLAKRWAQRGV